jgi:alpha-1,3-rhamnosyl/mannosyltransferase
VRKLRVGIDGRAFSSPAAGVRRYVSELGRALLDDPGLELIALGGRPSALPPGVGHVDEPWHPPTNLGWTAVGLPRAAARGRVDLIHAPAYTAPFHAAVPIVLTIHDVSYARHPEWYPYRRDLFRRTFYRWSARAASHVLTDSEFSRAEIVAAYGIPAGRITVAPLGVSGDFSVRGTVEAILPPGVTGPFLLHVGDLHPRRNLEVVVRALVDARRRPGTPAAVLVLAGIDRGVGDRLAEMAAHAGVAGAVVRLGAVDEPRLRSLYHAASALVYPSRYEGFGLPLVEAMASGTPVIASRAASIPEVVGEAALLLDPDDWQQWTEAIASVLSDAAQRARMRDAGLQRAALFTWTRTARITGEVYRRVARLT